MIITALLLLTAGIAVATILAFLIGAGVITAAMLLPIIDIAVFIGFIWLIVKFVKLLRRGS